MRFKKDKVKRSLNFKNMLKFRNSYRWLMIVLVISNIIFATLFLTKRAGAGNVVSTVGTIEVYDSDGVSPLTSYDSPLFTGGTAETFLKYFFVNNTGNQPVYVYWNISTSSIAWEVRTPNLDAYDHYEDGARKYGFAIHQNFSTPTDYWHPNREAILLDVSEGIKLRLELYYTGEPNTAEIFTMTLSFYATSEGCTHDIAVTNVTSSKTIVGQSYSSPINVTVENQGDTTETFNVTAYANTTIINTFVDITLINGSSITLTFTWNTTGFTYGNYTISAVADTVPGETYTADNTLTNGEVMITIPGDVNGDKIVDIFDIGTISSHWYPGPPEGPLGFDGNADINDDDAVDISDIEITSDHWGESW